MAKNQSLKAPLFPKNKFKKPICTPLCAFIAAQCNKGVDLMAYKQDNLTDLLVYKVVMQVGVRSPELISFQTFEIQPYIKFGNLSTQHLTQQMRVGKLYQSALVVSVCCRKDKCNFSNIQQST
ncbi:MAG: hypothetical protein K2I39_08525 [Muribaculaceae bacterium]|nr:hypothetical protein [Muribaculaceae bacterium]